MIHKFIQFIVTLTIYLWIFNLYGSIDKIDLDLGHFCTQIDYVESENNQDGNLEFSVSYDITNDFS